MHRRSSKNNPALSNVEADLRACSGATSQTETGADTQVCAYHQHSKLFAPLLTCSKTIRTAFQRWPARTSLLIAALLAAMVAGSRAWVGSGNNSLSAPIREPLQVVRFTLYDLGIYPREAVVNKGVIAISIEDLSGGSEGLILERETGGAITQVRRERKHWRGRGEIKLTPGRYRVYDASRPANRATLIVEP